MAVKPVKKQKLFNGRDASWMQFNRRVLEEAEDPANPLLERVKFLAITGSNLDEYVEIRQAGLMQRIEDGYREPGYDGLRPEESLTALTAEIHRFVDAQYACWNDRLLPELRKQNIRLLEWDELGDEAHEFAQNYFQREVDPLLTPISIDPAHPFPRVLNKALCLALLLTSCARVGVETKPVPSNGCEWVRPIYTSQQDVLTDGTARQILANDLAWQKVCGGSSHPATSPRPAPAPAK